MGDTLTYLTVLWMIHRFVHNKISISLMKISPSWSHPLHSLAYDYHLPNPPNNPSSSKSHHHLFLNVLLFHTYNIICLHQPSTFIYPSTYSNPVSQQTYHPSLYPSKTPSNYYFTCPSIYLLIHPCMHPAIFYPSIQPSISPSIHPSIHPVMLAFSHSVKYSSIHPSICVPIQSCIHASMNSLIHSTMHSNLHIPTYQIHEFTHPSPYFSFQPVLYDWCNKDCGMCYPVCGMVHIKYPLLLIGKSSPCVGSRFPLSLSEWSFNICPMPYNHK